jgi:hypothetical protein
LETGLVELRALGMEHQGTIDLLLEVINAQQVQHACELQQLEERNLEQEQSNALEQERNAWFESRLLALEARGRR